MRHIEGLGEQHVSVDVVIPCIKKVLWLLLLLLYTPAYRDRRKCWLQVLPQRVHVGIWDILGP